MSADPSQSRQGILVAWAPNHGITDWAGGKRHAPLIIKGHKGRQERRSQNIRRWDVLIEQGFSLSFPWSIGGSGKREFLWCFSKPSVPMRQRESWVPSCRTELEGAVKQNEFNLASCIPICFHTDGASNVGPSPALSLTSKRVKLAPLPTAPDL